MISLKSKKEMDTMREAAFILSAVMKELKRMAAVGISTKELNKVAEDLILKSKAEPAFKNYQGFPAALCTSINSQIVHGLPSDYKLKEGDILSLDLGVKYKGYYSDMALTIPISREKFTDFEALRLIKAVKKSLKLGIKKAKPGNTFGDVGNTIQRFIESQGFSVIRDLCGHGIGRELHQEPQILNYGKRHSGEKIKEGMVVCLEPMASMGSWEIKDSTDGFGIETKDGSLSAHFEDTIAVTKKGPQVLTKMN